MMKQELRKKYKKIRLDAGRAEVGAKSRVICQKILKNMDWHKVKSLCAFEPIAELNEVDIGRLLTELGRLHPDIKISVIGQSKDEEIPAGNFDLILVPCLAFDKDNYRLGRGGGFYDKFLATQSQALKVGVCFQNGLADDGLPHEAYDIALDKVITEASEV
jgi:5-formyltetrahydrofolate cyclo-ligase